MCVHVCGRDDSNISLFHVIPVAYRKEKMNSLLLHAGLAVYHAIVWKGLIDVNEGAAKHGLLSPVADLSTRLMTNWNFVSKIRNLRFFIHQRCRTLPKEWGYRNYYVFS